MFKESKLSKCSVFVVHAAIAVLCIGGCSSSNHSFGTFNTHISHELCYNQVQQISSHNSYDVDDLKDNIQTQFALGVRSFELDLHVSKEPQNWDVSHTGGHGDFVRDLKDGLAQLNALHQQYPNHEVITVWIELKDDWEEGGHSPTDLNIRIEHDLPGLVYRPSDLAGRSPGAKNLREVVEQGGWPSLNSLRGKFLFVTMGNDDAGMQYLTTFNTNGTCFVAPEDDLIRKLNPAADDPWINAVFFNCHNLDGQAIPQAVYSMGLVSRIWRVDDQGEYTFALGSKSHHIATDHVTREIFEPRLTNSLGQPFKPF